LLSALFVILYGPYKLIISCLWILSPLSKLNTVIQIKKKAENFRKVRTYLRILKEKVPNELYFDNHFYKMSIYVKLASLITQFVIDITLGLFVLYLLYNYSSMILELLHYFG
jgi:hypothetical protein